MDPMTLTMPMISYLNIWIWVNISTYSTLCSWLIFPLTLPAQLPKSKLCLHAQLWQQVTVWYRGDLPTVNPNKNNPNMNMNCWLKCKEDGSHSPNSNTNPLIRCTPRYLLQWLRKKLTRPRRQCEWNMRGSRPKLHQLRPKRWSRYPYLCVISPMNMCDLIRKHIIWIQP